MIKVWMMINPGYVSVYPPEYSTTYVKSTTKYDDGRWPYYATDPSKSLTGSWEFTSWISADENPTNQRFHIDLGSGKVVTRIYYENNHTSGLSGNAGVQNFTFWGSNTAGDFADLVYANNGTWVQLATATSVFEQHVVADQADPKYILVTNSAGYQYYAFKFADNYGNASYMGVRRIELQIRG